MSMNPWDPTFYNTNQEVAIEHSGVKGMKWGIRNDKKLAKEAAAKKSQSGAADNSTNFSKTKTLSSPSGNTNLVPTKTSAIAKLLGTLSPTIKKNLESYQDYTMKNKDGKTIGNVTINKDSKESVNLVWMGVSNKQRGQGHAQEAMKVIIDEAKKSGYKEMTLEVPTISPDAIHIYEKHGFKAASTKKLSSTENEDDDVWGGLTEMSLDLTKKK